MLSQTCRDFELIIVDDGSTDTSRQQIAQYVGADKRVVFVGKAHTGLADTLNLGVSTARGDWIARLDSDDVAVLSRLEQQLACAVSRPGVVLVGSGCEEIREDGSLIKVHRYPSGHSGLMRHLESRRKFFPHSSAFMLTAAVRAVGGYRSRLEPAEDLDLWLRLGESGRLASVPEPLVRLRRHPASVTRLADWLVIALAVMAALVGHFRRIEGQSDPAGASEEEWHEFVSWLRGELERRHELHRLWELRSTRLGRRASEAGTNRPSTEGSWMGALFGRPRAMLALRAGGALEARVARQLASRWPPE